MLHSFAKRIFDIFFALLGLVVFLPLMLMVALLIVITDPGPVFYHATRVGRGGKNFKMIKFRTMVRNADKIGPLVTAGNDPRITSIGRFLRKSKWDELPTLWNVLIGDMSFVGPRPENPESASLYNDEQRRILSVRPGITSLATIKYRHEEDILESAESLEQAYYQIMQDKLQIDLEYLQNQSLLNDIKIVFRTIGELFR